jgi:two-component system chemotaxis sensor kinase CheA
MLKAARASFYDDGANLEKTVHTLKELVLDARLLPLSTVFTLFPGMVRDLSKQNDKEVDMVIEGGELKVDKRILEEIKDPLMHLLRNAIDHGIESPAEREHHGKARRGVVRLRAFQHNNNVMIEVQDDGRGMDLSALKRAALKLGLHDEAMLDAMTPVQLQHLILLPGFSTSTLVTEMSGRGVGLDVVKINVERLQGTLHLETTPGTGTMMQLCLPLGLSTGRLLMVKVKGYIYGMPIAFVYTSRRILEKDIFMLEGRPAIILDGNSLLAFRLSDLLELPKNHLLPSGSNSITEHEVCIVIQVGSERLGLRVDEILDEEEVVTKPLSAPLKRVRNVSGLTILGNGEICAVLNPADLLLSAHKPTQNSIVDANAAIPFSASHAALKVAILLVEDSALIRTMEKRILEESGYEVVAVVDGLDALNALSLRSFAAVVSDINMPNMDGLALTARIRMDPAYKKLPVILVSSLASDEDKRHGLDVGANAYIPKPTFDQRILLETLKRLI